MIYAVDSTASFLRRARRLFRRHPDLRDRFERLVERLRNNPFEPALRLHRLGGELSGIYAVSLTYSYRVTLLLLLEESRIVLLDIGSHEEVYR